MILHNSQTRDFLSTGRVILNARYINSVIARRIPATIIATRKVPLFLSLSFSCERACTIYEPPVHAQGGQQQAPRSRPESEDSLPQAEDDRLRRRGLIRVRNVSKSVVVSRQTDRHTRGRQEKTQCRGDARAPPLARDASRERNGAKNKVACSPSPCPREEFIQEARSENISSLSSPDGSCYLGPFSLDFSKLYIWSNWGVAIVSFH